MLDALAVVRQFVGQIVYTVSAPLVIWPRRFWGGRVSNRIVRGVLSLVPLALLVGVLYLDNFIARVDAQPTRMPHRMLGMDGATVFKTLHHVRDVTLAAMGQLIYLRDGTMHILGRVSAEMALLALGTILWLEMFLASMLLLAPLHVVFLSRTVQGRIEDLSQRMQAPVRRVLDNLWVLVAERRHVWFAGTDVLRGNPLFVNVQAQRMAWVLGGPDRRSNALPFLAQVRAAVQGNSAVLIIDSVDNAGVAADIEAYATQAERARSFQRIRINEENAAEFQLDAATIQRERRVVYLGIPTHQKSLDIQEATKRALLALVDLGRANEGEENVLLVAVQDPRDLPEQATQQLTQATGLRMMFAQQLCDADDIRNLVACLGSHPRHTVLCLAIARGPEASNVAHAMSYASTRASKDKMKQSLSAPVLNAQMIQALRRGEAVALINGIVWDSPIRLAAGATKKRSGASEQDSAQL
jgi:hypothetical protein